MNDLEFVKSTCADAKEGTLANLYHQGVSVVRNEINARPHIVVPVIAYGEDHRILHFCLVSSSYAYQATADAMGYHQSHTLLDSLCKGYTSQLFNEQDTVNARVRSDLDSLEIELHIGRDTDTIYRSGSITCHIMKRRDSWGKTVNMISNIDSPNVSRALSLAHEAFANIAMLIQRNV